MERSTGLQEQAPRPSTGLITSINGPAREEKSGSLAILSLTRTRTGVTVLSRCWYFGRCSKMARFFPQKMALSWLWTCARQPIRRVAVWPARRCCSEFDRRVGNCACSGLAAWAKSTQTSLRSLRKLDCVARLPTRAGVASDFAHPTDWVRLDHARSMPARLVARASRCVGSITHAPG